jgi:hypothetical protein
LAYLKSCVLGRVLSGWESAALEQEACSIEWTLKVCRQQLVRVQPVSERISTTEDVFSPYARPSGEDRKELDYQLVEQTEALVAETLLHLLRNCPPDLLAEAAREDLLSLEPHLLMALEVLEDIEQRRSLTDEELSRRHSLKMLLLAGSR